MSAGQTPESVRVDVYSVGVLHTLQIVGRCLTIRHPDLAGRRWTTIKREVRKEWRYITGYCLKGRRWRALRNTFNGYLAEHDNHPHNCGRGWTKRAAIRRVNRLCAQDTPPGGQS